MGERERRGLVVDVNDLEFLVELEFHAVVQFHIVATAVTVELDDRCSGAEDKPNVHGDGGEPAVVAGHDAETLKERLAVVKRGLAFLGVVGYNHVEVVKGNVFLGGGLHDADAPIDIGRITIAEVVRRGDGKVGTGVEGLMTDEHAVTEGFPGEVLRGRETAMMKEPTFGIDDIGFAIENSGELTLGTVPL